VLIRIKTAIVRSKGTIKAIRVLFWPKNQLRIMDSSIIAPEIFNNEFFTKLKEIANLEEIKLFLEIGCSSGEGSTEALISTIKGRPDVGECKYIGFEIIKARHGELLRHYGHLAFVDFIRKTSVSIKQYPSYLSLIFFYLFKVNKLRDYGLFTVLSWMRLEKKYLRTHVMQFSKSGIDEVLGADKATLPDFALIDGSEFTGRAELDRLIGTKYIALDDILTFKNWENYHRLKSSNEYQLWFQDKELRNGCAIFKRISIRNGCN
jgi:hypothetical protein